MSEFVTSKSETISIGTDASNHAPPRLGAVGPSGENAMLSRGRFAKIRNTHATQIIYAKQGAIATTSAYDIAVAGVSEVIFQLRENSPHISLIASGAATTGVLSYGDFVY